MSTAPVKATGFGEYEPPPKVRQLLMSYFSSEKRSMTAILENAGLSWKWFYEKFQPDEEAVRWFNAKREAMFSDKIGDVWNSVYELATSGGPSATAAAKLYVERFDPKYRPESGLRHTIEVRMRPDEPGDRIARLREKLAPPQLALPAPPDPEEFIGIEAEITELAGER